MTVAKVLVRLPWNTEVPRGPLSSNTLYFDTHGLALGPVLGETLKEIVEGLYGIDDPVILGGLLDGDMSVSVYDTNDPEPRVPVFEGEGTATVGTLTAPPESTINLSFRAEYASGVRRQACRGHIQLGPLSPAVFDASGRISDAAGQAVADAGESMRAAAAGEGLTWVCGGGAAGWKPVTRVWVSNDPGSQSRRQPGETRRWGTP